MPARLNWSQVPAELRNRARESGREISGDHDGISTTVAKAPRIDPGKEGDWICGTPRCRYVPKSWADAERHADEKHHYRIEIILDGKP